MTSSLSGVGDRYLRSIRTDEGTSFRLAFPDPLVRIGYRGQGLQARRRLLEFLALSNPRSCEADHTLRKAQAYSRVVRVAVFVRR